MDNYSQELQANFDSCNMTEDGLTQVILYICGTKKTLTTTKPELKWLPFLQGEKIRLLYTSPTDWTIKKYLDDRPVDKYFRTD